MTRDWRTWLSRALVLLGALALFGLLYVLSVGPAVWLVRTGGVGEENAVRIYAPLEWLYQHTPLRDPLDAYVRLWT